jgi:polyvinyl alcohol dehydrogenase (cytochrome)
VTLRLFGAGLLAAVFFVSAMPSAQAPRGRASAEPPAAPNGTAQCAAARPIGNPLSGAAWNGWGVDPTNGRFQSARAAGLKAEDVPKLKLKWAFGFPNVSSAYAQPTIAAGRVYVGSMSGTIYSLDAATGCVYWTYDAKAPVRTAISIGPDKAAPSGYALYLGDLRATVHAIDAGNGERLWTQKIDDHPWARVTGAPTLVGDRLIVSVSSLEEGPGGSATYQCCTFRGSVVSLDAHSGKQFWKTYTIADAPAPTRKNKNGVQQFGPAGASVWSAPTVDVNKRIVYVATGNAYSEPAATTSDAVLALDLDSGRILWSNQITPNDVFVVGCGGANQTAVNCADDAGPDFDFGNSPILRSLPGGRQILVIGQKSGVAFGLDPDKKGAIVWQFRAGKGSALGGMEWGSAADEQLAYLPLSDVLRPPAEQGGLFAVKLATGEQVWHAASPAVTCAQPRGCNPAQSAAISVIPGAVFSGAMNGYLRAYSTTDGRILWEFNTGQEFKTVNGVTAKGGSINGPGPTIAGGMVFTNSGYGAFGGVAGNVLLAFGVN